MTGKKVVDFDQNPSFSNFQTVTTFFSAQPKMIRMGSLDAGMAVLRRVLATGPYSGRVWERRGGDGEKCRKIPFGGVPPSPYGGRKPQNRFRFLIWPREPRFEISCGSVHK